MATEFDKELWNLYLRKKELLLNYGFKNKLIHKYDDILINNLRKVYFGGVPASIILLCAKLCNGYCFDKALLLTLGFDESEEFRLVTAKIDEISLNPKYIDEAEELDTINDGKHRFVERVMKDGTTWVYDTTLGLVFEKELYYKMESPIVTKVSDKKSIIEFFEYQDIKNADIERDKYSLPLTIPNIELIVNSEKHFYSDIVKAELKRFKEEINYDDIVREFNEGIRKRNLI